MNITQQTSYYFHDNDNDEDNILYAFLIVGLLWAICANWNCFIRNLIYMLCDAPKELCCKKKVISVPV